MVIFVEYEDEWEKQQEEEEHGYYEAVWYALDDACSRFELICTASHRVDEMVDGFFGYQNQAEMYDRAAVAVREMLTNVQLEQDSLRNDMAAAQEAKAAAVLNEGVARTCEAEGIETRDNVRTELGQVCNRLIHFREWLSLDMPELLNIFDSFLGRVFRVIRCRRIRVVDYALSSSASN